MPVSRVSRLRAPRWVSVEVSFDMFALAFACLARLRVRGPGVGVSGREKGPSASASLPLSSWVVSSVSITGGPSMRASEAKRGGGITFTGGGGS